MGVFADQHGNVKLLQKKGMALPVDDYKTITKDQVMHKVLRLLTEESFQLNAERAQMLFFDQPTTPSERLVYAVNYTIRHKGAHHLTSQTALQLHWFHYYSLDVVLFLTVLILFLLVVTSFVVNRVL